MTELAFNKGQIENYKGIMLCTRPGENKNQTIDRPFISRVDPKDRVGINPCNIIQHRVYKQVDDKLIKHKKWLQEFSLRTKLKNEQNQQSSDIDFDRIERIKQKAAEDRKRTKEIKEEYLRMQNLVQNTELKQKQENLQLNEENLRKFDQLNDQDEQQPEQQQPILEQYNESVASKKKQKPVWALTKEEQEQKENDEVENLLNFVQDLDYDNYINDVEVNTMLDSLKQRIDQIKKQKDEKKEEQLIQDLKKELQEDKQSEKCSQTKSQRSTQQIKEEVTEKLKEKQDWEDIMSKKSKKEIMEDKIAKQVADEILQQYKGLKQFHSNSSIRKILETQAYKMLQNGYSIPGPKIAVTKTVEIDKNKVDPSYLPYLHRNPAV